MAREKKVHIRTKNDQQSDVFCGMSKSARFDINTVGPRAKGGSCQKCVDKQAAAAAAAK
jgi:hypothetical protein